MTTCGQTITKGKQAMDLQLLIYQQIQKQKRWHILMLAMAPMPTDRLRIRVRVRARVRTQPTAMAPSQCGQELSNGHGQGGAEREPHGYVHLLAEAAAADAAVADAEAPPTGLQVVGDVPTDGERAPADV